MSMVPSSSAKQIFHSDNEIWEVKCIGRGGFLNKGVRGGQLFKII